MMAQTTETGYIFKNSYGQFVFATLSSTKSDSGYLAKEYYKENPMYLENGNVVPVRLEQLPEYR